jgi:hypothetical protein
MTFRLPKPFLSALLLLGPIALVIVTGCGGGGPSPSASGSPTASSAPTASVIDFGPLAVVEGPGGGPDARGGKGPLHITATCVTMTRENGETVLLIWQSADVRWNELSQEITFASVAQLDAGPITLHDGDTITIGGARLDNLPAETQSGWLATPQPGCDGERWFVSGVIKE